MKVTVVTQVYNAKQYIEQCIKCVLDQTHSDLEYILIDNGCNDGSDEIIRKYAQQDSRIKVVRFEENVPTVRWQEPLKNCAGNYFTALDADDWLEPDYLERLVRLAETTGSDIVATGSELHIGDTGQTSYRKNDKRLILEKSDFPNNFSTYHVFFRPVWAKLININIIKKAKSVTTENTGVPYGIDTLIAFEWLRHANRICIDNSVLHHYRIHEKSVSHKYDPRQAYSDLYLFNNMVDFLSQFGSVSEQNMEFLYCVYANAIMDTANNLVNASLSPSEKLHELGRIMLRQVTKNTFKNTNSDIIDIKRKLLMITMLCADGLTEKNSDFRAILSAYLPQCGTVVNEKNIVLFRQDENLSKPLLADDRELLIQNLKKSASVKKYNRYDIPDMLRALSDDEPPAADGDSLSPELLGNENNFAEYLKLLKKFAKKYCVIVVSYDTPWGPPFTRELTRLMTDIGFRVDLYGKFRCPYAAVIDAGKLVFEKLESDTQKMIDVQMDLGNNHVRLVSPSFGRKMNTELITINGEECTAPFRGLHFVVFDKEKQECIDSINFDVYYNPIMPFNHVTGLSGELNSFINLHPGVSFISYRNPKFPDKSLTSNEQFIYDNRIDDGRSVILNNLDKHIFALNKYYDENGIKEVLAIPKSYHDFNGVRHFEDVHGNYINTAGGHRVTEFQPEKPSNSIFLCGPCTTFGIAADDAHTIASYLQKLLNENCPEKNIAVQNYGYFICNDGEKQENEIIKIIKSLPVKPGDIVISDLGNIPNIPFIDLKSAAMIPRDYEVFFDSFHYTPDGYRMIAEGLFNGLKEKGMLDTTNRNDSVVQSAQYDPGFDQNTNAELAEYKRFLTDFYNSTLKPTIGAAVMNCNPFTLGHRYLIEKALEQCDYLIVFAVEEDRSVFPFEDRLRLIDEGTKDLPNVVIIPSGKFVLSSLTFSEYFNKSEMQDRVIDTSLDVTVFAREIAPCLNITKRFAGEEPFDSVTRQYNETMRRVLPEYGIEFAEIPRAEISGAPVSASRVRELLDKRDFDSVEKLVPESTLRYLMELVK